MTQFPQWDWYNTDIPTILGGGWALASLPSVKENLSPSPSEQRTQEPLNRFWRNFIWRNFDFDCPSNEIFVKIGKNDGYFTWRPVRISAIILEPSLRNIWKGCQRNVIHLCSTNPCYMLMLVEIQQKLAKALWKSSYAILPNLFGFEDSSLLECYIISTVNIYGET
jgi:hypothetical protein